MMEIIAASASESDLILFDNVGTDSMTETALNIFGAGELTAVDINLDGLPDLVAHDRSFAELVVFLNMGNAQFERFTVSNENLPLTYQVMDVDNDGDQDILYITEAFITPSVIILENDGFGVFTEIIIDSTSNGASNLEDISSGDFNDDGLTDLIVVSVNKCFIYLQEGPLSFNRILQIDGSASDPYRSVTVGNFNGDGLDDFMLAYNTSGVRLYTDNGMSNLDFTESDVAPVESVIKMVPIDIDNDGDLDVVAANEEVYVFENMIEQLPSGITGARELPAIAVYPNPAAGDLYVDRNILIDYNSFDIVDVQGQTIRSWQLPTAGRFDVRGVAAGFYLLRCYTDGVLTGYAKVVIE